MTRFPVWARGELHAAGTPVIAAEDEGFQLGLAVFDTVLVEQRHAYFLAEHLARLERGARALDIEWPPRDDPRGAVDGLIDAVDAPRFALRLTLSRGAPGAGPSLVVTARDAPVPPAEGVLVEIASEAAPAGSVARVKSTSRLHYALEREAVRARGAFDALFVNAAGDLTEGTLSNVFLVRDRTLVTPNEASGCLAGIVRGALLGSLERDPPTGLGARVDAVPSTDLERASEVLLTNTTGGVIPVRCLRHAGAVRELPGPGGPVAQALATRWAQLASADRERARGSL